MLKRKKLSENYHHLRKFKKRKYLSLFKTIKDASLADETLKLISFSCLKICPIFTLEMNNMKNRDKSNTLFLWLPCLMVVIK